MLFTFLFHRNEMKMLHNFDTNTVSELTKQTFNEKKKQKTNIFYDVPILNEMVVGVESQEMYWYSFCTKQKQKKRKDFH